MRKRFKNKLRSCASCKPHKTGRSKRHTPRDLMLQREYERDAERAVRR